MKRDPQNYRKICETVLGSTIEPIDFTRLFKTNLVMDPNAKDPIYEGALSDNTPVTLVQAPSGTGKSRLIEQRIQKLIQSGIEPAEILVLAVNLTRASQLSQQNPGVLAMPFNEFTQQLFDANIPMVKSAGRHIVIAAMLLAIYDPGSPDCFRTKTTDDLIAALQTDDPLERWIRLTELSNQKTEEVIELVSRIGYACHELKSTIAQNRIYKFRRDVFDARTILIDGVHNMPLPVLCAVLEYAYRFRSSLFITGDPNEGICEFNMAYADAISRLTAKPGVRINRLSGQSNLPADIQAVLAADNKIKLPSDNVMLDYQTWDNVAKRTDCVNAAVAAACPDIVRNMRAGKQSLILARSQKDARIIKDVIRETDPELLSDNVFVDLTRANQAESVRSRVLMSYYPYLRKTYTDGLPMNQLFGELYNMLSTDINRMENDRLRQIYVQTRNTLLDWANAHVARFNGYDVVLSLNEAIRLMMEMEAEDEQIRFREIYDLGLKAKAAPVVLSTIHGAISLHSDYVLAVMTQDTGYPDLPLWKTALSRAKEKERIAVISNAKARSAYQTYLLARANA